MPDLGNSSLPAPALNNLGCCLGMEMQLSFLADLVTAAVEQSVPRKRPGPLAIGKAKAASHPFPPNQVESQSQGYVPTKLAQLPVR